MLSTSALLNCGCPAQLSFDISESDLWTLLGHSSLMAGRVTEHTAWYTHATDCANAILNKRYTTYTALSKAAFSE